MLTTYDIIQSLGQIQKLSSKPVKVSQKGDEISPPKELASQTAATEIRKNALQLIEPFMQNIQNQLGEGASDLLRAALIGLGLSEGIGSAVPPYSLSTAYKGFYNHELYQKILPVCQLVNLIENNGEAEEHAFKLATILKDEKAVLLYLLSFKNFNKYNKNQLVHDACLFALPAADECDFVHWKQLANTQSTLKLNLLNPRFREVLPHAEAIEEIGQTGKKINPDLNPNLNDIHQTQHSLSTVSRDFKKLASHGLPPNATEAQRIKRDNELMDASIQKFELQKKLVNLCQALPLEKMDVPTLEALYACYQNQNHEASHQILINNGITAKYITQFDALNRQNDDTAIPNCLLDGTELGYPGFYLKKMDVLSDKGAALAACLGKITYCCQYLGGVGTACAIHGITSPNGGFYVVCKGDAKKPSLDDPIIAQAWAWKGTNNALCLDSIEAVSSAKTEMIADLFRWLGHTLCSEKKYGISYVNTGTQSGITLKVAVKDYPASKTHYLDYSGYSDSKDQLLLANPLMPYLFYGEVHSAIFQNQIVNETQVFFDNLLKTEEQLKDNQPLKQAIAFAFYTQKKNLLELLRRSVSYRQEEFDALVDINKHFLKQLDKGVIEFEDLAHGAYINGMNHQGQSAFHLAALRADEKVIEQLIALNINVNIQDKYGNTVLHSVADNPQRLEILLKLVAKQALNIKNNDGNTVLHLGANNPKSLEILLELLPEEALKTQNNDGDTVFHLAAWNLESLEILLEFVPEQTLKIQNNYGDTVFHLIAKNPGCLDVLPDLMSEETLKIKNNDGDTVLHLVATNSEIIKSLLESLPKNQRFEAMMIQNHFGNTLLHLAANKPESLKCILEEIPQNQRLNMVKSKNQLGYTVLYLARLEPECLKLIPEKTQKEIVMPSSSRSTFFSRREESRHYDRFCRNFFK